MTDFLSNSIFRAYDIRGIYGQTLFDESAYLIARGFVNYLKETYPNKTCKVFVGYDGRLSSPNLRKSLIDGLKDENIEIIDIGLCPTPLVSYLAYSQKDVAKIICGIMITGSHNPKEYNGFKITVDKNSFFGENLLKLRSLAKYEEVKDFAISYKDFSDEYINRLLKDFEQNSLNIVWDCANGATGNIVKELVAKLYKKSIGKHIIINEEIDGNFPNHHPDPTVEKNLFQLRDEVLKNKFDLGISFDGDGDRIGIVLKNGRILKGYETMVLFARDVIARYQGNDVPKIIADVKTSNVLFKDITFHGGKAIMWKTGHSYIKSKLKEEKALLAGEMSGHIFFADKYYGFDDAIYSAIRMVNIANTSDIALELKSLPKIYTSSEIKYDASDDKKFELIETIKLSVLENLESFGFSKQNAQVSNLDGIRISDDKSFLLIRASNTTPSIVIAFESFDKSIYDKIELVLKQNLKIQK
jgi:phosphomannomutase